MENTTNLQYLNKDKSLNDEIDIRVFFSFLLKNKKFIALVSIIFFLTGCLYSLTLKRVWEGQFQIVLKQSSANRLDLPSNLASLLNRPTRSDDLKTQVGILNSPSVLMPIYDLVNSNKNLSPGNDSLPFNIWKRNLVVELEKDTSILNIAYRDKNRDLILPALKKLSLVYQDYSTRNNKRSRKVFRLYLQKQIEIFKQKSSNSIKIAQDFAIDQDLIFLDTKTFGSDFGDLKNDSTLKIPSLSPLNVNIEEIRVQAANKIRILDLQIKKISELKDQESDNILYIGSTIPDLIDQDLPQELQEIDIKLVELRSKYKEDDVSIKKLKDKRDLLIDLLKERTIKYLQAEKLEAESLMEASMRPKGVLLKYKELIRQASRDELTLIKLENDLRLVELEEAKTLDPWQLITKPTLLKNPVAPSRRRIGIYALLNGFFVGCLIAFIRESRKGKILYFQNLDNILSLPLIDKITKTDDLANSKDINFFFDFISNQSANKISFIVLDKINYSFIDNLVLYFTEKNKLNKKVNCIFHEDELSSSLDSDFALIFVSLGESKRSDIKALKNKLELLNIKLNGYILLN